MNGEGERILATLAMPEYVQEGDSGTLIAVRHYSKTPLTEKYCCVVYRELSEEDGFVLTAYFATRPADWINVIWER
jgi:hypothetical protein